MEQSSTDKRIDDLNHKVDQGFERVDTDIRELRGEFRSEFAAVRGEVKSESAALRAEMKAGFDSMNERFDAMTSSMNQRFDAVNERFERMHRLLIQFCGGLFGSFVVAAAALIATQL